MSTPDNNEEKRFALRMGLRLPIVISGRGEDGGVHLPLVDFSDSRRNIAAKIHAVR